VGIREVQRSSSRVIVGKGSLALPCLSFYATLRLLVPLAVGQGSNTGRSGGGNGSDFRTGINFKTEVNFKNRGNFKNRINIKTKVNFKNRIDIKTKVKSGGQECPPHTIRVWGC